MRYALLICTDESAMAAASPAESEAMMNDYNAFSSLMPDFPHRTARQRECCAHPAPPLSVRLETPSILGTG